MARLCRASDGLLRHGRGREPLARPEDGGLTSRCGWQATTLPCGGMDDGQPPDGAWHAPWEESTVDGVRSACRGFQDVRLYFATSIPVGSSSCRFPMIQKCCTVDTQ